MSTASTYDARYLRAYMARWPESDRRRVADIVASLGLPEHGRALDFGCAAGVGAAVLAATLPGWEVWGTDISTVALNQARARVPGVHFAVPAAVAGTFDFVFSHHVLEHVVGLTVTAADLARLTAPAGAMLHILPCGNAPTASGAAGSTTPPAASSTCFSGARATWPHRLPLHASRHGRARREPS